MKKILVIDDDKLTTILIKESFKKDFEIDVVNSCDHAIEKIKNNTYDIIILDIILTNCIGYELVPLLKKYHNDHIIIYSAMKELKEDNIYDLPYVTKEDGVKKLKECIEKYTKKMEQDNLFHQD